MPLSEQRKEYLYGYQKAKLKRIPLDVQKYTYEAIKLAADSVGNTVNGFIKEAIFAQHEYQVAGAALERQGNDDREQIKNAKYMCENHIAQQIERIQERCDCDDGYINSLYEVNREYMVQILTGGSIARARLWEKISENYGEYLNDIHNFYDPIIDEYDESEYNDLVEYVRKEIEDNIVINLSVDNIDEIKTHAEAHGESVNAFIVRAIDERISRDTQA